MRGGFDGGGAAVGRGCWRGQASTRRPTATSMMENGGMARKTDKVRLGMQGSCLSK